MLRLLSDFTTADQNRVNFEIKQIEHFGALQSFTGTLRALRIIQFIVFAIVIIENVVLIGGGF